jgi:hypothetical protein
MIGATQRGTFVDLKPEKGCTSTLLLNSSTRAACYFERADVPCQPHFPEVDTIEYFSL